MIYVKNFITEQQENEILKLVPCKDQKGLGRNQILRFGSKIPYNDNNISSEIPDIFNKLNLDFDYDSVTINEYYENQFIEYHYDQPESGDKIYLISLLGYADMNFRNQQGYVYTYNLEPRSLFIMKDELRWQFEHSATAKGLRYSVVFRNSKEVFDKPILCGKCKYYHLKGKC